MDKAAAPIVLAHLTPDESGYPLFSVGESLLSALRSFGRPGAVQQTLRSKRCAKERPRGAAEFKELMKR